MSGTWVGAVREPLLLFPGLFVLLLAAVLSGCDSSSEPLPPVSPNTYRIVSSLPSKGPYARDVRLMRQAIDLAVEQAILPGIRFEHVALDGGDPEGGQPTRQIETANAQRAVDDPSVIAYIGPWTSEATGWSLPTTSKAGLLHIGVTATWPGLTQEGWDEGEPEKYYQGEKRNFVRLVAPDSWQGRRAARWMRFIGVERAIAIEDGSSYSQGIAKEFIQEWQRPGGTSGSIPLEVYLRTDLASGGRPRRAFFFAASTAENAIRLSRAVAQKEPDSLIFFTDTAMNQSVAEAVGEDHYVWNRFVVYNGQRTLEASDSNKSMDRQFRSRYGEAITPLAARAMKSVEAIVENPLIHSIDPVTNQPAYHSRQRLLEAVTPPYTVFEPDQSGIDQSGPGTTVFYLSQIANFDPNGDSTLASLEGYVITRGQFRFVRRLAPERP